MLTDDQIDQIVQWKLTEPHVQNKTLAKRLGVRARLVDDACNRHAALAQWRAYVPRKLRAAPGTAPKKKLPPDKPRYGRCLDDNEVAQVLAWREEGLSKNEMARRLHRRNGTHFDNLCDADPRLTPADEPPPPPARHGAGRRRKTLTKHQLTWLQKWTAEGHGLVACANKLHVSVETLKRLIRDDPDVGNAHALGKEQEEHGYVSLLQQQAERGNPVPAMFLLKSRAGYRDQGPSTTISIDNSDRRSVVLPQALPMEEYMRLVETMRANLPGPAVPTAEPAPAERKRKAGETPILVNKRRYDDEY